MSVQQTKKLLDVENDMRLCLCNVTPSFQKLTDNMQAQCSH